MTQRILIATTNPGKVTELQAMLGDNINWLTLGDFENIPEIEEDGKTFAENAQKKALGYAKATGLWTIADDSGLVVDALNGQPGIKSARFSGEKNADKSLIDHKNIAKVLELLKDVPKEKRTARFVCHLCLASTDEVLLETKGTLEGFIAQKQEGKNGFGYDPVFFVPQKNKTVAQMDKKEKNSISHRGNAIKALKPLLNQLLEKINNA